MAGKETALRVLRSEVRHLKDNRYRLEHYLGESRSKSKHAIINYERVCREIRELSEFIKVVEKWECQKKQL